MKDTNGESSERQLLADVRAAADELLARIAGPDIADSDLFPYGINRVTVNVRAGDVEVNVEVEGPDHSHGGEEDDEEWLTEDMNGFDLEEDRP